MKWIKYIIYAAALGVIYLIVDYLRSRDNTVDTDPSASSYAVRPPAALKYVCLSLFILGMIMFFVFLFFRMKGNPTATAGHLWMAAVIAVLGIAATALTSKWRIVVEGSRIEVHRLFRSEKTLSVTEIDRVEVGKKNELILYADGKKLATVDGLSDNYSRFRRMLEEYGKIK